jgi:hypothetical protein
MTKEEHKELTEEEHKELIKEGIDESFSKLTQQIAIPSDLHLRYRQAAVALSKPGQNVRIGELVRKALTCWIDDVEGKM